MERDKRVIRQQQSKEMKDKHLENHMANVQLLQGVFYHGKYYGEVRRPKLNQQGNVFDSNS